MTQPGWHDTGEVRLGNSCSICGEDERWEVKSLLAHFRKLPPEEQRHAPALLNGLGPLHAAPYRKSAFILEYI